MTDLRAAATILLMFMLTGTATAADPTVLDCALKRRSLGSVVVFQHLKKLRIWYGDGGGQEWPILDVAAPVLRTTAIEGRRITLTRDFRKLTFDDDGEDKEHDRGLCKPFRKFAIPKEWVAVKLVSH